MCSFKILYNIFASSFLQIKRSVLYEYRLIHVKELKPRSSTLRTVLLTVKPSAGLFLNSIWMSSSCCNWKKKKKLGVGDGGKKINISRGFYVKYFVNKQGDVGAHTQPGQVAARLRWMVLDVAFLYAKPLTNAPNQHSKSQVARWTPDSKEGYGKILIHINTTRTWHLAVKYCIYLCQPIRTSVPDLVLAICLPTKSLLDQMNCCSEPHENSFDPRSHKP